MKRRLHPKRYKPAKAVLLAVIIAIAGVATLTLSQAADETDGVRPEPVRLGLVDDPSDQILVRFKANVDEMAAGSAIEMLDATEKYDLDRFRTKVLTVPRAAREQVLQALKSNPRVEFAEADQMVQGSAVRPNDTEYELQWLLHKTSTDLAWDRTKGSSSMRVAVLDSGANLTHPELAGKLLTGVDYINGDNDPADDHGHGSAVSGVIAANSNNGAGVSGACWECKIIPIKVLDAKNQGTTSELIRGLEFAADNGAKIINISINGEGDSQTLKSALDDIQARGILTVVSAGNKAVGDPKWPATYDSTLSAAATDPSDNLTSYSNFGTHVDIAAPGRARTLAGTGTGYVWIDGTSFAAPTVSGIAALLWSAYPNATAAQIRTALTRTTDPCCGNKIGGGRVNAARAMAYLAGNGTVADTVKPTISFVSPIAGSSLSGKGAPLIASAADNTAVAKVHIGIADLIPFVDIAAPFMLDFDTTKLADGEHTVTMTAYDAAGNATAVTRTVTINNATPADTTKPTISIASPAEGATVRGTLAITLNVADNIGVARVESRLDEGNAIIDIAAPFTLNWDTTKATKGQHKITSKVVDNTGNSTTLVRTVTVDNTTTTPPPPPNPPTPPPNPPTPPPPGPGPKVGDLDDDGRVGLSDMSRLFTLWGTNNANADLNKNGRVELGDLSMMFTNWTR